MEQDGVDMGRLVYWSKYGGEEKSDAVLERLQSRVLVRVSVSDSFVRAIRPADPVDSHFARIRWCSPSFGEVIRTTDIPLDRITIHAMLSILDYSIR